MQKPFQNIIKVKMQKLSGPNFVSFSFFFEEKAK